MSASRLLTVLNEMNGSMSATAFWAVAAALLPSKRSSAATHKDQPTYPASSRRTSAST